MERKIIGKFSRAYNNCFCGYNEFICEDKKSVPIFYIDSINDLNRFVGMTKYANSKYGNVFLRGQNDVYNSQMKPSILRNITNSNTANISLKEIADSFKRNNEHFKDVDDAVLYPILQHYGIHTHWLDIVDNIWVALWFGSHCMQTKIVKHHKSERKDKTSRNGASPTECDLSIRFTPSMTPFTYVFLLLSDGRSETYLGEHRPGIYEGEKTVLVDIRKVVPSIFIRPHAQHAYTIKSKDPNKPNALSNCVVGVAKLWTRNVLEWIGNSSVLSLSTLYPSLFDDAGFLSLLESRDHNCLCNHKDYGGIHLITY